MWREDSYANRRMGILLLSLAGLAFTTLDATVKWLVQLQTLPLLELICVVRTHDLLQLLVYSVLAAH